MTEQQPATIAREAKGIHQSLKELLKAKEKEPYDREVDFQRKSLRRRYLNLLLAHPRAKESKDVENHLWMQTSYAFIASYKQRILALDRIIQNKLELSQERPPPNQRNNTHIVEHRKLVQRFRQFLAEEEKFWNQLVVRLRRSFGLDEATAALVALGILSETEDSVSHQPEGGAEIGRNHFQFPPEDASTVFVAESSEEREAWLGIVAKALICLGDINRYRELYNGGGGRPRAGQEEGGPGRRGRNRRGGGGAVDAMPRPRNYDRAQHCYEQARLLVPSDGNPSHQLAILATYRKDSFLSLTHYYRALCVRTPYDTASDNLNTVLSKALEQWRNKSRRDKENMDGLPPREQIELLKEKVVVLHALWKVGVERGVRKMEALSRRHYKGVFDNFFFLVSQRFLPTDMINNVIVLSQGALWKHRMIRSVPLNRRPDVTPPPEGTPVIVEWHILEHLFDVHRALLEVGIDELKVPPPKDVLKDDLAQRITAAFRRTLPALRIASKWLRANIKYIMQDHEFVSYQESKSVEGVEIRRNTDYQLSRHSILTRQFWRVYAEFMTSLSIAFPISELPPFTPLEEDIEMRGFLPLKNMMGDVKTVEEQEKSTRTSQYAEEVHPNDWQLMRILDLLNDGKELVAIQDSCIMESYGVFRFKEEVVEPAKSSHPRNGDEIAPPDTPIDTRVNERDDDSLTEQTSRTDEEILHEAFQFLHGPGEEEFEDQDDEIVWDPKGPVSPVLGYTLSPTPSRVISTPVAQTVPLKSPTMTSPPHTRTLSSSLPTPNAVASVAPTTAQDLLNDVMSGRATRSHLESSAPQPPLLFGSGLSHLQGHNIWSASQDEQSLKFTSQPNQTYQHRHQAQGSISLDPSQSIWSPSYQKGMQNSQHDLVGIDPAMYDRELQTFPQGTHQHQPVRSASMSRGFQQPVYYNHSLGLEQDPLVYAPATSQQQAIHRPSTFARHGLVGDSKATTSMSTPLSSAAPMSSPGSRIYDHQNIHAYFPYHHQHYAPNHHLSMSDPQLVQPFAAPPPPMSHQIWGNVG